MNTGLLLVIEFKFLTSSFSDMYETLVWSLILIFSHEFSNNSNIFKESLK